MRPPIVNSNTLSDEEQARFKEAEATIEKSMAIVVRTRRALKEIRDQQLYLPHYATFEDYCVERWNMPPDMARTILLPPEDNQ